MVINLIQNKSKIMKSVYVNVKNQQSNMYMKKIIHGILAYECKIVKKKLNRKANRTWVDKGSEFYIESRKSLLESNDIGICSKDNEGKSVVAEQIIKTLKNKYMTT